MQQIAKLLVFTFIALRLQSQTLPEKPISSNIRQSRKYIEEERKHAQIAAAKSVAKKLFEQVVPYWTTEPGWHTELQLRNNLASEPLTVDPYLRTSDGNEIQLTSITLLAGEVSSIDLMEAMGTSHVGVAERSFPYGSILLKYNGRSSRNLYASVMVHRTGNPIMYHLDASMIAPAYISGSREGVWWLPNSSTRDYLIVTNQSQKQIRATLSIYDASGTVWNQQLLLNARETQRLSIRDLVIAADFKNQYGGIRIQTAEGMGSLDSVHFLFDESSGFSATMKMFDYDPRSRLASVDYARQGVWITRAPMLALSHPDAALGLPENVQLRPMLLIRNVLSRSVNARIKLHWRSSKANGFSSLPAIQLDPYQTQKLDVEALQRNGVVPLEANWAQVTLATDTNPDEIVAIAASYDPTLRYGAQTPFSDQMSSHLEGGQWMVDWNHNSIIAAGNGSSVPVDAVLTIFYDQGRKKYQLKRTIAADNQWWINVGDLIRSQMPDIEGNILPSDVGSGAYQLREAGDTLQNALYEGKVVTDKTYGHATYGCMICCGYGGDAGAPYLVADPTGVAISDSAIVNSYATNACSGVPDNVDQYFAGWSTQDASIMIADVTSVTGIAIGGTRIIAQAPLLPAGQGQDQRVKCPMAPSQAQAQGNVVQTTWFTNPLLGYVQNDYEEVQPGTINWDVVSANTNYFSDYFQDASTVDELARNCPSAGPLTMPCWVVKAASIGIAGAAALEAILQASRGRSNPIDSGIQQELQQDRFRMYTVCQALQILLNEAKAAGDTAKVLRIQATQKGYGCRNKQKRG